MCLFELDIEVPIFAEEYFLVLESSSVCGTSLCQFSHLLPKLTFPGSKSQITDN
jgi:hypothetical protein